nr:PREDICTED: tripartite motif-containing protein 29 isoform X2 [Anolis carolinensis]|eukprot:XP_008102863.1 PREDICTED: tripartite motif-containing protein 29 isoform X2 [Anolis carolinensis]
MDTIPCDFCLEKPNSAVTMCLTCEASLCQAHLSKHNSKGTQKCHVLVALKAAEAQEAKARAEHAEWLEGFCQDNAAFPCATGSHEKDDYEKQQAILSLIMKSIQENNAAMNKALQQLQKSADQIKGFQLLQERVKKENFSNDSVEVLTVHLDQSDIQVVRNHTAVYISNLDTLMQVVHGKIINQTQWSRVIPAAEFSLEDVICEVFPSPPPSENSS